MGRIKAGLPTGPTAHPWVRVPLPVSCLRSPPLSLLNLGHHWARGLPATHGPQSQGYSTQPVEYTGYDWGSSRLPAHVPSSRRASESAHLLDGPTVAPPWEDALLWTCSPGRASESLKRISPGEDSQPAKEGSLAHGPYCLFSFIWKVL